VEKKESVKKINKNRFLYLVDKKMNYLQDIVAVEKNGNKKYQ
jgi:hypothetical protein